MESLIVGILGTVVVWLVAKQNGRAAEREKLEELESMVSRLDARLGTLEKAARAAVPPPSPQPSATTHPPTPAVALPAAPPPQPVAPPRPVAPSRDPSAASCGATDARDDCPLPPIVAQALLVRKHLVELIGFLNQDVPKFARLMQQHRLQAHQLQHRQEHADQRPLAVG